MIIDDHFKYTWDDSQTEIFRGYEDETAAMCEKLGLPEVTAASIIDRYNSQRLGGEVDPETVLNRFHNRLTRLAESGK